MLLAVDSNRITGFKLPVEKGESAYLGGEPSPIVWLAMHPTVGAFLRVREVDSGLLRRVTASTSLMQEARFAAPKLFSRE